MASGSRGDATFSLEHSNINAGRDLHLYNLAGDLTVQRSESSILTHLKTVLNPVPGASFDSYEASRRSECFQNTRVQLLKDIEAWINGESYQAPIYILDGVAGIGKSTVAQTIAIGAANLGLLGASFFFSRDEDSRRVAKHVFPTIAFQLACYEDAFTDRISRALDRHPDAPEKVLHQQLSLLLMEPLQDILSQRTRPTLIIMDALDECEEESAQTLLTLLGQYAPRMSGLKIFITTRPEWHVRRILDEDQNHDRFRLHEIEESIVQSDIRLYLHSRLSIEEISKVSRNRRHPWQPDVNDMNTLCGICGTLFIIAATAAKFILDPKRLNPQKQLSRLLDGVSTKNFAGSKINVLDETYILIIFAAQSDLDESDNDWFRELNKVLGALITLANPLPSQALASLLGIDPDDLEATLSQLHSLVAPSGGEENMTFRIHHKSFPDFITDMERIRRALTGCKLMTRPDLDSLLWIDVNEHHLQLAKACLRIMNRDLRWNMAEISEADWYKDMDDILHVTPQLIPRDLAYAALHWADHLLCSHKLDVDMELQEYLEAWSSHNILAWIEVMVIIKQIGAIFQVLNGALDSLNHVTNTSWIAQKRVQELLSDTSKFVQRGNEVMRLSPMHIYRSCLPMVPTETALYRTYGGLALLKVTRTGRGERWDGLITAFTGHTESVGSVAFSIDGSRLASGSSDTTVRLWDIKTSAHIDTLTGHEGSVNSVAFSPNGSVLASGSDDQTIRLWNAKTGVLIFILTSDAEEVSSVLFSRDSSRLLSAGGSEDEGIIQLWDVKTGAHITSLTGHSASVSSVASSWDGSYLASASCDATIRIWDSNSCRCIYTLEGHTASGSPTPIAFSSDGSHLASGSDDWTIWLWDFKAGTHTSILVGHTAVVCSIAYSNDSLLIASGSSDGVVRLWDVKAGVHISTFTGHSSWVSSVAFSADSLLLASGSQDSTVRLWNLDMTTPNHRTSDPNRHLNLVSPIVFSSDGSQIASGSDDCTVRLWNARSGALILTFNDHSESIRSIALSSDGSRLISGSFDHTVRIWDARTGAHIRTLPISFLDEATTITFSSDRSTMAISDELTNDIRLWDVNTGIHTSSLTGHSSYINSVAFSNDGSRLASGSQDDTIRIWEITTGLCQSSISITSILGEHSTLVDMVGFSHDDSRLVFTCFDKSAHICDANTGSHISTPLIALSDADSTKLGVQLLAFLPEKCQIVQKYTNNKPQSAVNHSTPNPLHLLLLVQRETPIITGLVVATLRSHEWETALLCWCPQGVTIASFSLHSPSSKVAIGCSNGHIMLLDFSHEFTYHSNNTLHCGMEAISHPWRPNLSL